MLYSTILMPGEATSNGQLAIVESMTPADLLDALSTKRVRLPQSPEGVGPLQVSTSAISLVWTLHSLGINMFHLALNAVSRLVLDRDCSSQSHSGAVATSLTR